MTIDRLTLIGCGKKKAEGPRAARFLYTGSLFAKRRQWAERFAEGSWAILSAKHGVVGVGRVIYPYDVTLSGLSAEQRTEWSHRSWGDIKEYLKVLGVEDIEIHAGAPYVDALLKNSPSWFSGQVILPLRGQGIGQQMKWYSNSGKDKAS